MNEGNFQGITRGAVIGNLAVAKVRALLDGKKGDRADYEDNLPINEFGTMKDDVLHAPPQGPSGIVSLYGLLGSDVLHCDTNSPGTVELLGGYDVEGNDLDVFVIHHSHNDQHCLVRDFEAGESIHLAGFTASSNPVSVEQKMVGGFPFTDLFVSSSVVATFDGHWEINALNTSFV